MSALDQAFIKVYKQEPGVSRTLASGQKPAADARRGVESQYADGTLYHDLPSEPSGPRQVPSPHAPFPQAPRGLSPTGHHSPATERKPRSEPQLAVQLDCQVVVQGPHWAGLPADGNAQQIAAWVDTDWGSPHVDTATTAQRTLDQPTVATPAAAVTPAATPTPTPTATPAPTATPTAAVEVAWEVDRFHWPEICQQLYDADAMSLEHAGQKLRLASDEGLRVLAVGSAQRGEGRTTLALCLARAAARAGVRVAVLETDFGSRQIAARLGVDTPCDWPQTARRGVSWTEAAIWSIEDRITVLPLAEEDDEPPLRLDEPSVTRLIDQLRGQFELIIIDTPPLGDPQGDFFAAGDDCPVDAVILVRDQRVAVASHTQQVVRRIREAGIEAVGLAHNYCKHPNP